jgi:hypothetical protein
MNLTLKDVSPEIAKLLKQRAKDNRRTVSEEVIAYLSEKVCCTRVSPEGYFPQRHKHSKTFANRKLVPKFL